MSLYIDKKFVSLLSPRLKLFKQKGEFLFSFRCQICGDSKKNPNKARGFIYRRKSNLFFSCHNCGVSLSFGNLLKTLDPFLYKEYVMERFQNESKTNVPKPDFKLVQTKPVFRVGLDLPTLQSLREGHTARNFISARKVPVDWLSRLYYADDFSMFVKSFLPDETRTFKAEPRIVIPFYDTDKSLLGMTARSLGPSVAKYITLKTREDARKVFGLDRVDFSRRIYVVEGPIDSMFLPNAIASQDASLHSVIHSVGDYDYVFVHDNQPRNKDVCKQIKKIIDLGKDVCIWPDTVTEKDINDMVLAGHSPVQVQATIDANTYSGLRADIEFSKWRKV